MELLNKRQKWTHKYLFVPLFISLKYLVY
jgi:hypothetical protein